MQIKRANPISNTFVEQQTQPQPQPVPATSLGIGAIKDTFEKPNFIANNPQAADAVASLFPEPDKVKAYLSKPLSPIGETKLKPPPKHEKETERPSNS